MIAMIAFNFALLAGTAYLVSERGWSPWWIILAACSLYTFRKCECKEE